MAGTAGAAEPLVVVKLGGSVLTRKRQVERLRPKVLDRLARELASADGIRLVVLHGAGSFGHPGARRFGLARAPAPGRETRERGRGASIVATEVRRLHLAVLRALVAGGTRPYSIPAAPLAVNRAGVLADLDTRPFARTLDAGLVPVSFGDVVLDEVWGTSILSAHTIETAIARTMRPSRVVFVSDVPGILTGPAQGRRTIVAEVTDETVGGLAPSPGVPDVTGGIRGKAEAMRAIARAGCDAALISGLTDGALSRAVRGESVYGSWAHAEPR